LPRIAALRGGERLKDHVFAFSEDTSELLRVRTAARVRAGGETAAAPGASVAPKASVQQKQQKQQQQEQQKQEQQKQEQPRRDSSSSAAPKTPQDSYTVRCNTCNNKCSCINAADDVQEYTYSALTVFDFCERMVIQASKIHGSFLYGFAFAGLYALVPTLYRIYDGVSMSHWTDASMIALSTIMTTIMYNTVLVFLVASYADFRRRALLEHGLSIVISDTLRDHTMIALHKRHTLSPTERFIRNLDLPSIELTIPSNVRTFMLIHEVFRCLGAEFSARIAVYNTGIFLMNVLLLVLLIGQIIAGTDVHPISLFYVFATVGSLSFVLGLMALAGASANAQAAVQRHALLRIRARVQVAMSERQERSSVHRRLAAADRVLGTAIDLIESDDNLQPIRILGVRASGSTLGGFAGGFITTLALILQVISPSS
jgi:hypothetical protein